MAKLVNIYTDGACSGNQNENNIGGWGCVLECSGIEKELHGGEINTTNNRMELSAFLNALKALKEENLYINVFSDSSYLINCFKDKWYEGWLKNDWRNSKKQPVENKELWEEIINLTKKQYCNFYLVKGHISSPTKTNYKQFTGHNGDKYSFDEFCKIIEYNNRCDALANMFINENKENAV